MNYFDIFNICSFVACRTPPPLFLAITLTHKCTFAVNMRLSSNPSCNSTRFNTSSSQAMQAALKTNYNMSVVLNDTTFPGQSCQYFDGCMSLEYTCFTQTYSCNECMKNVYNNTDGGSVNQLNSDVCNATVNTNATDYGLEYYLFQTQIADVCRAWPTCTLVKTLCRNNTNCNESLSQLQTEINRDLGVEPLPAVNRSLESSPLGTNSRKFLNDVMTHCVDETMLVCDYWRTQCWSNATCKKCFLAMEGGNNILQGSQNGSCQELRTQLIALPLGVAETYVLIVHGDNFFLLECVEALAFILLQCAMYFGVSVMMLLSVQSNCRFCHLWSLFYTFVIDAIQ